MPGPVNKQCPRCHCFFECNMALVSECKCAGLKISHKQREYIKSGYDDCLCRDCLKEVDQEINNAMCDT
jgi:hypothetical protein